MEIWAKEKAKVQIETEGFISGIDTNESVYLGYLGEAAWWKHHPKAKHVDARDYDFELNGKEYDVKGYWSQFKPRPGYTVYIPAKNMNRGSGFYCFVAVMPEKKIACLIGEIECERFRELAVFRQENEDKHGRSGQYRCDCYELFIEQLTPYEAKYSDRPYPFGQPGDCLNCPAMGGWKPYDDESMHCFHSAKYLKKAAPPIICTEAVLKCPRMEET